MFAGFRLSKRSFVLGSLASTMILSLVYSTSIRYGHADVPVAMTAAEIRPLGVGDKAPRFTVETVDNERFDFDPRKLERPAVLISFRGGWCPYCNLHLSELRHAIPEINAMGVDVLFLSGDRSELLLSSLSRETQADIDGLDYTVLSDANAQAAMALGIAFKAPDEVFSYLDDKGADIEESSMARHGVLPVPAVFVVNREGTITYAYANPDYKIRLPADQVVAAASESALAE
ncbi:MAG: AhpC/TSA family protein [Gammaproteobacteria bacterium]|nr:AhpC/TSA family protein [Gammaproteobacteria bacterium]NNC57180.1 AhpC/TSA family protein [Woeseiaceae bacterium]NNL50865.1 AhpC/TSA family protein [Woeseiaceae bacterium]